VEIASKIVSVDAGKLYASSDGRRVLIADCSARVEVREHLVKTAVLGRGRVVTNRSLVLLITFDHRPDCPTDDDFVRSITRFEFQGRGSRADGVEVELAFDNCLLDGTLDLTAAGECQFEVICTPRMLARLRGM
jgi:hypothetical protein